MPRVKTQTRSKRGPARKCGSCGAEIQPGEKYYIWSFRYGGKHYRCMQHPPKPSELTQSKMSTVYAAQEAAHEDIAGADSLEGIADAVHACAAEVQQVADEYHEAAEHFGQAGENQERGDELESWAQDLESWEPPEQVEGEVDCEECEGTGEVQVDCEKCYGTGKQPNPEDEEGDPIDCEYCEGARQVTQPCEQCEGHGKLPQDETTLEEALDAAREEATEVIDACPI